MHYEAYDWVEYNVELKKHTKAAGSLAVHAVCFAIVGGVMLLAKRLDSIDRTLAREGRRSRGIE